VICKVCWHKLDDEQKHTSDSFGQEVDLHEYYIYVIYIIAIYFMLDQPGLSILWKAVHSSSSSQISEECLSSEAASDNEENDNV